MMKEGGGAMPTRIGEGGGGLRGGWGIEIGRGATTTTHLTPPPLSPPPHRLVQPHAEAFGARCNTVDPSGVINFGEEVVRGQPVFMLR